MKEEEKKKESNDSVPEKNNDKKALFYLVYAAMFAALTCAVTFFPKIPIGSNGGYIHLGDAVIFLSASVLPLPFAMASGAVGGMLSDIFSGSAAWAPWTFAIKALMCVFFTSKKQKMLCRRNYIAPVFALIVSVVGYYAAEGVLYSWASALTSAPFTVVQDVAGAAVYYAVAAALDKGGIKKKMLKFK